MQSDFKPLISSTLPSLEGQQSNEAPSQDLPTARLGQVDEQYIYSPKVWRNTHDDLDRVTPLELAAIKREAKQLDIIIYLNDAKTIDQFYRRVGNVLRLADNLQDWAHVLVEPTGWVHEGAGTVPKKKRNYYAEEQLYHWDLMIRHAKRSNRPILQSDINNHVRNAPTDDELYERNALIARLMEENGYKEYWNYPFSSACSEARGIFCVATRGGEVEPVKRAILANQELLGALAIAVDQVGCARFNTHFPKSLKSSKVNPAPLRLLETMANYKCTVLDAAEIMGISEKTAYHHSRVATASFGKSNIHQTVLEALHRQVIRFYPYESCRLPVIKFGDYKDNET